MEGLLSIIYKPNYILIAILLNVILKPVHGMVTQLDQHNLNDILQHNEFVMVNFYADWCRFSQILHPIFEEAGKKIKEDFPNVGRVAMAKVDCDKESAIAAQYHISKYPTIKMFRNGVPVKKEYRGQRSVEAIHEFVKEQLKDVIKEHTTLEEIENLDENKRNIIGYFEKKDSEEFITFTKAASVLRETCDFHAVIGEAAAKERVNGDNVLYRPKKTHHQDNMYTGPLSTYEIFHQWAEDKCIPLIREITFENAEELTEEGLPFIILFHHPDDTSTVEAYNRVVAKDVLSERHSVNFLTADGAKFSHPLHHLGKTQNDLPLLAIDSFRHMYVWSQNAKTDLEKPGLIKQFIADLHSNKLHREFHHGPESTEAPAPSVPSSDEQPSQPDLGQQQPDGSHVQPQEHQQQPKEVRGTDPPESTFKKLAPSRNRYTLLRDEL